MIFLNNAIHLWGGFLTGVHNVFIIICFHCFQPCFLLISWHLYPSCISISHPLHPRSSSSWDSVALHPFPLADSLCPRPSRPRRSCPYSSCSFRMETHLRCTLITRRRRPRMCSHLTAWVLRTNLILSMKNVIIKSISTSTVVLFFLFFSYPFTVKY